MLAGLCHLAYGPPVIATLAKLNMADEATLFDLAGQFEVAAPWWDRRPKVHAAVA